LTGRETPSLIPDAVVFGGAADLGVDFLELDPILRSLDPFRG